MNLGGTAVGGSTQREVQSKPPSALEFGSDMLWQAAAGHPTCHTHSFLAVEQQSCFPFQHGWTGACIQLTASVEHMGPRHSKSNATLPKHTWWRHHLLRSRCFTQLTDAQPCSLAALSSYENRAEPKWLATLCQIQLTREGTKIAISHMWSSSKSHRNSAAMSRKGRHFFFFFLITRPPSFRILLNLHLYLPAGL